MSWLGQRGEQGQQRAHGTASEGRWQIRAATGESRSGTDQRVRLQLLQRIHKFPVILHERDK